MLSNFPSRGTGLSATATAPATARLSSSQLAKRQKQAGGVRRLSIAPTNGGSSANSSEDARTQSEAYYHQTWARLLEALDHIFANAAVGTSVEVLYRGVESLCRADKGRALWANLRKRLDDQAREVAGVLQTQSTGPAEAVAQAWGLWSTQLGLVRNIFFYLDRSYLLATGQPAIVETGLGMFKTYVVLDEQIGPALLADVAEGFVANRRAAAGAGPATVPGGVLRDVVKMMAVLGVYGTALHPRLVAGARAYYAGVAAAQAATPVSEYLALVTAATAFESEQALAFGLERATRTEAVAIVKDELVRKPVAELLARGFDDLIDDDDVASLTTLHGLLTELDEAGPLMAAWTAYIRREGQFLVSDPKRDGEMVGALLAFKDKLDKILTAAFGRDDALENALREAFGFFINKRQSVPAEMIAKHIDGMLRVANKEMDDTQLERAMDKVLVLFRFIQGKDVFEAFYKKDLAKRLLLNKSASTDAERSMLARLKTECGTGFTQKLEGMFKDIELSKDFMGSYKQTKYGREGEGEGEAPIDLYVNVLSQAFWPTYPDVPVVLPGYMATALESFKAFYLAKQTGRKLMWRHSLGHCILRADLPRGRKELSVSVFQTAVLLLFNDVADGKALYYADIKAATGLPDRELARTLQSLACGKVRVLSKDPRGRDVAPTDRFAVNLKFQDKAFRLHINQIQLKETPEENKDTHEQVMRDRQYEIQACIIRILKSRKSIKHVELIQQTIEQTKNRGTLDLGDIKKNIEKLIEKEYMERTAPDTYVYVA
ncbi:Cullin family-domain-containing protein [Dipodascopsis tothii]|uniref:Cullin family-domain-containing protein n=1 Tax=Dipodascopsis tothii TaxID=44089 RepID=UPI0034CF7208